NIHNSGAEIVRLLDYIVGRVSGQFTPKPSPLQNDIRYGTGAYAVFGCYSVFAQISQPVFDNGRLYSLRYSWLHHKLKSKSRNIIVRHHRIILPITLVFGNITIIIS
ncbi:MAG: hypothetical protein WB988_24715, partial [Candidatus Nitrosopolaris sp.]